MTSIVQNIKEGRDLQIGDIIRTEGGDTVRITRISRGMIPGCRLVEWQGGWGHIGLRKKVPVSGLKRPLDEVQYEEGRDDD